MLNSLQTINFRSNIIVSSSEFSAKPLTRLINKKKCISYPCTIQTAGFFDDEAFTPGAITCTSGFLKARGGKKFFMFHLNPENSSNSWTEIEKGFLNAKQELIGKGAEILEGFLLGAYSSQDFSMALAKNLIDFFRGKEMNVRFSALLGQKNMPFAHLHYLLPKNEAVVYFKDCDKAKKIEDLGNYFSETIFGDDTFEFRGR